MRGWLNLGKAPILTKKGGGWGRLHLLGVVERGESHVTALLLAAQVAREQEQAAAAAERDKEQEQK